METRLLIVTHEKIGYKMAGPAIRTWEIAKALSNHGIDVTVSFPFQITDTNNQLRLESYCWESPDSLEHLINKHDVLFATGPVLARILQVIGHPIEIPVIVDLYDVVEIEKILMDVTSQRKLVDPLAAYLNEMFMYLRQGDFFVCGCNRQLDFWLGCLLMSGRINHENLPSLHSISSLIEVVPMGIPSTKPPPVIGRRMKGLIEGISDKDKIIFWGGGIWDWSDPITLLEAFELVLEYRQDVKLVFGSLHHHDENVVPEMSIGKRFFDFLGQKKWPGKKVFFLDWIPYEIRSDFLLEADVGVSLFLNPLESRYAVRSRLMDHLWTGLPTISTIGDEISELLFSRNLAKVVEIGDVKEVAKSILFFLEHSIDRNQWMEANKDLFERYQWNNIVAPLINFLRAPIKSSDSKYVLHTVNYLIPLRKEWEKAIHQIILLSDENRALKEEISMLRNRKVVKIADFYGKIRDRLLGK